MADVGQHEGSAGIHLGFPQLHLRGNVPQCVQGIDGQATPPRTDTQHKKSVKTIITCVGGINYTKYTNKFKQLP